MFRPLLLACPLFGMSTIGRFHYIRRKTIKAALNLYVSISKSVVCTPFENNQNVIRVVTKIIYDLE